MVFKLSSLWKPALTGICSGSGLSRTKGLSASRREAVLAGTITAAASMLGSPSNSQATITQESPLVTEIDKTGRERMKLQPGGWNTWKWRDNNVNWVSAGNEGPVVLLIHGFGASVYHWRNQYPALSKHCRVYALDCLGFGWSDKPVVSYNGYDLWTEQIADFLKEVAGVSEGERAILVGNSLGGYNALATAARHPELVQSVVLLNAAGRFEEGQAAQEETPLGSDAQLGLWQQGVEFVSSKVKRAVIGATFIWTKQPIRIKQVLKSVYVNEDRIDDDLVRSIAIPAEDPNAPEVFYRVITAKGQSVNKLLDRIKTATSPPDVFLLWGEKDPWCVPARATQIQNYYPAATRTDILSGHCPHDDSPDQTNKELLEYILKVSPKA